MNESKVQPIEPQKGDHFIVDPIRPLHGGGLDNSYRSDIWACIQSDDLVVVGVSINADNVYMRGSEPTILRRSDYLMYPVSEAVIASVRKRDPLAPPVEEPAAGTPNAD